MPRIINMKGSTKGKAGQSGFFGRAKATAQSIGAKLGINAAPKVDKRYHINAETWATDGQWVKVKSSNVRAIQFNAEAKQMWVEFGGKGRPTTYYVVLGMEKSKAKSLFNAPSIGRWYWANVRRAGMKVLGPFTSDNSFSSRRNASG